MSPQGNKVSAATENEQQLTVERKPVKKYPHFVIKKFKTNTQTKKLLENPCPQAGTDSLRYCRCYTHTTCVQRHCDLACCRRRLLVCRLK